jgi:hypothetical protein
MSITYQSKRELYIENFSFGNFINSANVNDKLIVISLLSLLYLKLKKDKPDIKPLDILLKIMGQQDPTSGFYNMLESLSIMVEDFTYECNTADSCGLKNGSEISNKIKQILSSWMPF